MTQKRRKGSALRWIILVLAAIVFIYSAWKLGLHSLQGVKTQKEFSSLKVSGRHDLDALHRRNSDVAGWIKIKGTRIDYPVMQTPEDPEYYLRRNFNKEDSLAGTPFIDAASHLGQSRNILIYGHNMKNGTMFHSLLNYEKKTFYRQHPTFFFDTYRNGHQVHGTYEVIAAFRTSILPASSGRFRYHTYADLEDPSDFRAYAKGIRTLSAGTLPADAASVIPKWGDQLVTLSTCAYHTGNGRFVVVGRRISTSK